MVQQHGHRAANSIRLSTKQAPRARSFSPACVKAGLVDIGGVHEYAVPQKEWTGFGDAIISLDGEADAIGTQGSI